MFSFAPLQRRVVAKQSTSGKAVLLEQINILPIGGGVWFSIRNLTKNLECYEEQHAAVAKSLTRVKASIRSEIEYINQEMGRIGFFAEAALVKDPETGEFKIVDLRQLVAFRLGESRKVTASDTPKRHKETFGFLSVETRKPSSGNQQKKKQQNN